MGETIVNQKIIQVFFEEKVWEKKRRRKGVSVMKRKNHSTEKSTKQEVEFVSFILDSQTM